MSRFALVSGPSGAVALGGLLFLGAAAGQAQEDHGQSMVEVVVEPGEEPDDDFDEDDPFPWPDFVNVQPQPGLYRMKMTVGDLQLPDFPEARDLDIDMEEIMRSSMTETETFCVAPDSQPSADWLGDMADEDCSEPVSSVDGNDFTYAIQCQESSGGVMHMRISGTVEETRSRMVFDIEASEEEFGEMTMQLRVATDRIGDCD